jgi:hypothetical protein
MRRETWKFRKRRSIILSVVAAVACLILAILVSLRSLQTRFPDPHPSPHIVGSTYEKFVWQGDAAFNAYEYDIAYHLYQRAERDLAELTHFEQQSPSKDINLLQRYHNANTLLRARIELTLITKDISELQ